MPRTAEVAKTRYPPAPRHVPIASAPQPPARGMLSSRVIAGDTETQPELCTTPRRAVVANDRRDRMPACGPALSVPTPDRTHFRLVGYPLETGRLAYAGRVQLGLTFAAFRSSNTLRRGVGL